MMLEYIGYHEAAKLIEQTADRTITQGVVTNDLSPTKSGVSCAKYGEMFVEFMNETMPG
jgi:isocitrate dehydrogenase